MISQLGQRCFDGPNLRRAVWSAEADWSGLAAGQRRSHLVPPQRQRRCGLGEVWDAFYVCMSARCGARWGSLQASAGADLRATDGEQVTAEGFQLDDTGAYKSGTH